MRIYALCLIMVVVVGAPLGFEIEHVEIEISINGQQMMDESHFDVFNRVNEGAIVTVLALGYLIWEAVTKLGFVLVLVV